MQKTCHNKKARGIPVEKKNNVDFMFVIETSSVRFCTGDQL
jgi:hypothetical protein